MCNELIDPLRFNRRIGIDAVFGPDLLQKLAPAHDRADEIDGAIRPPRPRVGLMLSARYLPSPHIAPGISREVTHEAVARHANNCLAIRSEALLTGTGIALIPKIYVKAALADGRLFTVLDDWLPEEQWIYALSFGPLHDQTVRVFCGFPGRDIDACALGSATKRSLSHASFCLRHHRGTVGAWTFPTGR
jgi:hypothetical protein